MDNVNNSNTTVLYTVDINIYTYANTHTERESNTCAQTHIYSSETKLISGLYV